MRFLLAIGVLALALLGSASNAAETASDVDKIVVSRSGVSLTIGEIDAYMQTIPDKDRAGTLENADRTEKLIVGLLLTKQLAQQAKDMKLDQNESTRRLLAITDDQLLAKLRMDKFVETLKIPDMKILAKERYLANKEQFAQPEKVSVQHILISTDRHSDAEAHALANTVYKEASANPADFSSLVEKYSEDPGKAHNSGTIQDAASPRLVPEFAAAAKALRSKDEIAPVTKTKFGYHIIKLVSYQPAQQQSFAEAEPKLISALTDQYVENQRNQFLGQISTEKNVTDPDAFATLRTRYLQAGQQTPTLMNEAQSLGLPVTGDSKH